METHINKSINYDPDNLIYVVVSLLTFLSYIGITSVFFMKIIVPYLPNLLVNAVISILYLLAVWELTKRLVFPLIDLIAEFIITFVFVAPRIWKNFEDKIQIQTLYLHAWNAYRKESYSETTCINVHEKDEETALVRFLKGDVQASVYINIDSLGTQEYEYADGVPRRRKRTCEICRKSETNLVLPLAEKCTRKHSERTLQTCEECLEDIVQETINQLSNEKQQEIAVRSL